MRLVPAHDPRQPLTPYDRRKLDLLVERVERRTPLHDAWLLLPQHEDELEADPLELLELVARLRRRADELEVRGIRLARRARFPWSTIGRVYGISRQAAHNRFAQVAGELTLDV